MLLDETGVVPAVDQIELHPYLQQEDLRAFHAEHGVVTEAWSPIGQGGALLADETIAVPESVTPERIRSNLDVLGLELTDEEMSAIAGLERAERIGPDPDVFG